MRAIVLTLCFGFSACAAAQDAPVDFNWMQGVWHSEPDQQIIEETWTNDAGHMLLGMNRTLVDGEVRAFEYLRITYNDAGEGEYCAQPGGGAATCFELVERGDQSAVFENPDHDFPQRIAYSRTDNTLTATISDLSGEQSFSFVWTQSGN